MGLGSIVPPRAERGDGTTEDDHALVDHLAALRRYARALLGGTAEADDLVQECLVRALARTSLWRPVRNMRAYLFTILHNVHADRVSRRSRTVEVVPLDGSAATHSSTPPTQYGRLELRDLALALTRLSEEQRQVVLLVGLEGMSYQEVAIVLDVPVGTVMSRLSRGREALRQLMAAKAPANLRRVK
ncbi:MAG TPA: RNA polymerase sigma factor [Geminicoccaceae bacterium]|nr:RNA polymerase sigma factor [Geminicoccaceae bacterium]